MPLVAAALLPHSPALLPGLAPEVGASLKKTITAINEVAQDFSVCQLDILFIIAAHTETDGSSRQYALLQSPTLAYAFAEFGDLVTTGEARGAVGFTHRLKERMETAFPVPLVSVQKLPYTFSIPYVLLSSVLGGVKLVCLQLPKNIHLDEVNRLAHFLSEHLASCKERVALVAAGDLGHLLEENSAEARIFDQAFQVAVVSNDLEKIINIDSALREKVKDCLWAPTVLMYASLQPVKFSTTISSYEAPLGVGFLVARILLG